MADSELIDLTETTTPASTDILYIVVDPGGTPVDRKVQVGNLGLVAKSLYDANTILAATSDNTPVALTVGASTIVGRKASGDISAMSGAEAAALLAFPSVKVYRSAALAITTASETTIDWDAEETDTNTFHDNSTNPSRLTVPTGMGGLYLVGFDGGVATPIDNVNERMILRIKKNGTEVAGGRHEGTGSGAGTEPNGCIVVPVALAATDYVTATIFHQRGSDANFRNGTSGSAFWMVKIGS